jgi:hypothetical protein
MPRQSKKDTTTITVDESLEIMERDEFASIEFVDLQARLPRIQALRGMTPELCGYFISKDEMAKGANQATFSQEWQKFINEMTACHAIANGIAARPKNALFNCLCVFAFQTARELVGKKQKLPACRVVGHESPLREQRCN